MINGFARSHLEPCFKRRSLIAYVLAVFGGASLSGLEGCESIPFFHCQDDADCRTNTGQGQCEVNGLCSFEDPACETGRRFGSYAGRLSGSCVHADAAPDEGTTGGPPSTSDGFGDSTGDVELDLGSEEDKGDETGTGGEQSSCGNAVVEPDEQCDDGNDVDTDECTNDCSLASCFDEQQNGTESGIDCGGVCGPCLGEACTTDQACPSGICDAGVCVAAASCAAILELRPMSESGPYIIDADGPGGILPRPVYCDMAGGWTRILRETPPDAFDPGPTMACPPWHTFVGPFSGQDQPSRTIVVDAIAHEEIRVEATLVVLDSWEAGEALEMWIDSERVWTRECSQGEEQGCFSSEDTCGDPAWADGTVAAQALVASSAGTITLEFSALLDEEVSDEAFGIAGLAVYLR